MSVTISREEYDALKHDADAKLHSDEWLMYAEAKQEWVCGAFNAIADPTPLMDYIEDNPAPLPPSQR